MSQEKAISMKPAKASLASANKKNTPGKEQIFYAFCHYLAGALQDELSPRGLNYALGHELSDLQTGKHRGTGLRIKSTLVGLETTAYIHLGEELRSVAEVACSGLPDWFREEAMDFYRSAAEARRA